MIFSARISRMPTVDSHVAEDGVGGVVAVGNIIEHNMQNIQYLVASPSGLWISDTPEEPKVLCDSNEEGIGAVSGSPALYLTACQLTPRLTGSFVMVVRGIMGAGKTNAVMFSLVADRCSLLAKSAGRDMSYSNWKQTPTFKDVQAYGNELAKHVGYVACPSVAMLDGAFRPKLHLLYIKSEFYKTIHVRAFRPGVSEWNYIVCSGHLTRWKAVLEQTYNRASFEHRNLVGPSVTQDRSALEQHVSEGFTLFQIVTGRHYGDSAMSRNILQAADKESDGHGSSATDFAPTRLPDSCEFEEEDLDIDPVTILRLLNEGVEYVYEENESGRLEIGTATNQLI